MLILRDFEIRILVSPAGEGFVFAGIGDFDQFWVLILRDFDIRILVSPAGEGFVFTGIDDFGQFWMLILRDFDVRILVYGKQFKATLNWQNIFHKRLTLMAKRIAITDCL